MSTVPDDNISPIFGGSIVPPAAEGSGRNPLLVRLPRLLLWCATGGSALIFLFLGFKRLFYPLELDCIEGVMMDHVVRLAHGQSIYVEPSLSFIPLAYMPFFAFAGSLLARAFGPEFWEPRLVSMLAVIGTAFLIVRIVRSETRSWTLAAAGAAIYFMGFGITGSCYDVARPDSLMIFFALAGLATLRFSAGIPGALAAAALLSLGFFTKQHAAWFVLAGLVHLVVNDRRRLLPFGLAVLVGCAGGYALLGAWLGPWFKFFTLEIPSHWSEFNRMRVLHYLGHGLIGTLGLLSGPAVLSLGLAKSPWRGPSGIWIWTGCAAIGTGLLATLDPSAYLHLFIPTMVVLCVLGPISLHRLMGGASAKGVASAQAAGAAACLVLLLQFIPLLYPVHEQLPHPRAIEAYQALLDDIRHQPGPVLAPYHGWYTWRAGKGTSLHIIPLDDIERAHGNSLLARDPHFLERMFEPLRHGVTRPVIIADVPLAKSGPLWAEIEDEYELSGDLGWITAPLRPVSGNQYAPTFVYRPRQQWSEEVRPDVPPVPPLASVDAASPTFIGPVASGPTPDPTAH